MYVANSNSHSVSVIDISTNTTIANIHVGSGPQGVAYDSNDSRMYVGNDGSGAVSVIAISPHHTTITSATDGNGQPLPNRSSTLSTYITFHVTATQGTYPIAVFQCSLDNRPSFSSCGTAATNNADTITIYKLAAGQQHTIKVRAVDTQGNVDPVPATFS